jgi:hypothetical protein
VDYAGLMRAPMVPLLGNTMRSVPTVPGITMRVAAAKCVVASAAAEVLKTLPTLED